MMNTIKQVASKAAKLNFNSCLKLNKFHTRSSNFEKIATRFPGSINSHFSSQLNFININEPIPTYRVMNERGEIVDNMKEPEISKELAIKMYEHMITLNLMDTILYDAQRQGRISFYMTAFGEEAQIGSAAALTLDDVIFGQYREAGVLIHRGFTIQQIMHQCYGNSEDIGKGRQMPVHYGSKQLNFQSISSPLCTQLPQASGAAYALKQAGKDAVAVAYFGEGAASEGDFHAALNMAATLSCPVIFFCRNNGFAISTPAHEQYKGDGIGYGIDTIRVDGNDIFAVYNATKAARKLAIEQNKPVLIEAMSYRVGHHSTSDDSSAYRSKQEVEDWKRLDNPIVRYRQWLENKGYWNQTMEDESKKKIKKEILTAFKVAEELKKPSIKNLFTDVYDDVPKHLLEQQNEMLQHIKKYPEFYPVEDYEKE
ncbi:2-oxoisovalerate dehydrogenase subunit alpha mitochondrial precursor [Neoconidiobolus thromboides FSU 785]|nr:2-oxoisovalerate dehydrogenase subunit alpha mitochondrial precursor [Neoconidiobolus thromboides FSU 785]